MMRTVLLGDIVDLEQGLAINAKTSHLIKPDGDLPLLRITDLLNDKQTQFIDSKLAPKQTIAHPEDIIYTRTGQVGCVFMGKTGIIHNNCFKVVVKDSSVLPRYLYWFLKLPQTLDYMLNVSSGSAQKDLGHSAFKSAKFIIPDLDTQRLVISICDSLDEMIALNRRMNETLEKIGQALFKNYFIDNPEVKTWQIDGINKYADCVKTSSKPPFSSDELYIALEHFTQNSLAIYAWSSADTANSNKTAFKKGDVLFGKLRPYFHKVAIAPLSGVCSTDILPVRARNNTYTAYIAHFLNQDSLIDYVTKASEGTRMPRTSWATICNYKINLPPEELLEKFSKTLAPIHGELLKNIFEIRNLTELRNSLLPRLITGEIKL